MAPYKHGIYNVTTSTENAATDTTEVAAVVIGTAPVHLLADPTAAVNTPILCRTMSDCYEKLGYSEDYGYFSACQAMYEFFLDQKVAPVVFINVLDPTKATHKESVEPVSKTVANGAITIEDPVIVSTLVIKQSNTAIAKSKYETEWIGDKLVVNFTDSTITGSVTVEYDKMKPTGVTSDDIIGAYNSASGARSGAEVIKTIFPTLGVVPFLILAPGWSHDDTVGAVLAAKASEINGCYKGMAIIDLNSSTVTTKTAAIAAKNARTLDENCIISYPAIKKAGNVIYASALIAALIMKQATETDGLTCSSPSNKRISIEDVVLTDANNTSVFYDQEDGNDLNAEGIVTFISRNGWYVWGNNTAAYPAETDPVKRWIMTRLTFLFIENDFINSNFSAIDGALSKKMVEDIVTNYNIKLASYAAAGHIAGATIYFDAGDNTDTEIMNGHFTFRTALAANVPGEAIFNIFSFDTETLRNSILGGATNE